MSSRPGREMLQAGARAPGFRLRGLDGKVQTLDEILAAGPALIAFFKITCPICQFTLPFLDRLHHQAAKSGLQFLAVSQDPADGTRKFNRDFGVTFPALLDDAAAGYPASNAFGITHVPSLFLVEKDGTISWSLDGFSKRELEHLGERVGASPFRPGEYVPEWKAG